METRLGSACEPGPVRGEIQYAGLSRRFILCLDPISPVVSSLALLVIDQMPHLNSLPNPESVVVVDNCGIHNHDELEEQGEFMGAHMVFLAPYSPIHNPIEKSFGTYNVDLQAEGENSARPDRNNGCPFDAIELGMDTIGTSANCRNWIRSIEIYG